MINNIYKMTLKLITPSEKGSQLDFTAVHDDILEAASFFNEKFRSWSKRILIYAISKKTIHVLLCMENEKKQEGVSARELRYFTSYLNDQKNWRNYSRSSSKLFESANMTVCNMDAALRLIDSLDPNSDIYNMQKEEIDFFTKEGNNIDARQARQVQSEEDNTTEIMDEEAIAIVTYLLRTKNKGTKHEQKKETISRLKELLKEWV